MIRRFYQRILNEFKSIYEISSTLFKHSFEIVTSTPSSFTLVYAEYHNTISSTEFIVYEKFKKNI